MNSSYFQPTFEEMNTSTLQLWLHEAQCRLPTSEGAVKHMLMDGIRAAASELLFRWRRCTS
jgi:hypothetical protein